MAAADRASRSEPASSVAVGLFGLFLLLPACGKPTAFQAVSLKNEFSGSGPQQYVAFVPVPQPDQPLLPVLLFLNGVGENGSDGLLQLRDNLGRDIWRRRNQFPILVVSSQCAKDGRWTADSPDTKYALSCIDDAIERFGGDPDRVYISGVSAGGSGVMSLVSAYPERFAAAIPIASGASGDPVRLAAARMPLRYLVNRLDKEDLLNDFRQSREQWFIAGLSPVAIEIDGMESTPHNAWDEAYSPPLSFWWLMQQGRSGPMRAAMMQMLKPSEVLATWKTSAPDVWRSEPKTPHTRDRALFRG